MESRNRRLHRFAVVLLVLTGLGLEDFMGRRAAAETDLLVFAAASTTNALTEIGELYAARNSGRITPSFASASTLAKQIERGAPADIYLSANQEWMDYLEEKHLLLPGSRFDLLSNRIVLIAPANSPIEKIELAPGCSLTDALGKDGRLSLGDPDHVPAGMYGKQALEHLGIWDRVKDRLAPMKDVRAALVLVERGETPLGLVYATDAAISGKVRVVGTFPEGSHPPIVYPVAAVSGGKTSEAQQFLDFLRAPAARTVFEKYGFIVR
ncbi:MAG: molybdate ABC transporter substrate-binding protein [Deltaproteobacteria bacterium]|nr:molybdate ABC transporter substrate-binding protein [Deltaproteobacteria bacterium]